MFEEERKISILNKIQSEGRVSVAVLARKYQVSESTIRRDLTSLEDSGFVKRTHGGAILQDDTKQDYNYNAKRNVNLTEKQRIAETAASLVKPGSTIFLGTSTMTNLMAQKLKASNLTIATNSLDVINVLSQRPDYNLIVIGGNYIHRARTIEGLNSLNQILQMHFQQAYLGANGIDAVFGLSTVSDIEANSKRSIIQNSSAVYFLCEHKKFDQMSQYKIAEMHEITAVITDSNIDKDVLDLYQQKCQIIVS